MKIRALFSLALLVMLLVAACTPKYIPYDEVIVGTVIGQKGRVLLVHGIAVEKGDNSMAVSGEINLSLATYNARFDEKAPLEFENGRRYRFYLKRLKNAELKFGIVLAEKSEPPELIKAQ